MAGIGEVSAVIGVVQVGFSLARTLNTYIGDYKDSRDSIISLAAELDATIIQVKELNSLVANNKAANSLGDGSKKLAEKCVKDSERLIKRLVELLTKAKLPEDPDAIVSIKPGDIIVGKLTRAYWPLIKPQVDVVKSELHVMKTDILLARSCIQSQSGNTPAGRAADGDSIVALAKSRQLARKLLREAKAEEKRSAEAMQRPSSPPYPSSGRRPTVDDPFNVPGSGSRAPYGYPPMPRRPIGLNTGRSYGFYGDDSKETELIARDLRESILEDLQRKDAERKAKARAEEEAQQRAVDAYQKTVKEKLARLQASTEATQRQMQQIFGPGLDEKHVQKFLDEQRARQLQDEFGEMLLSFGIGQHLQPGNPAKDGHALVNDEGKRTSKRRWFFKRPSTRSSASTTSNHHANAFSPSPVSQSRTHFLNFVLAYDIAERTYSCQTFNNPALKHEPCGPICDIESTMRAWQTIPQPIRKAAFDWITETYPDRLWHLHAALPLESDVRKTRKFLQKAILGEVLRQGTSDILLVFSTSSTDQYAASPPDNTAAGDAKSESSRTSVPASEGAASRVELSKADLEQMRDWLVTKGLSTAKIAELEAMVTKQKEAATTSAPPQAPAGERLSGEEQRYTAATSNLRSDFREPNMTVRFAADAGVNRTQQRSDEWVLPNTFNESAQRKGSLGYPTAEPPKDSSIYRRDDRQGYREYSLPPRAYSYDNEFGERERSFDIERVKSRGREAQLEADLQNYPRDYYKKSYDDVGYKPRSGLTVERDQLARGYEHLYRDDAYDYRGRDQTRDRYDRDSNAIVNKDDMWDYRARDRDRDRYNREQEYVVIERAPRSGPHRRSPSPSPPPPPPPPRHRYPSPVYERGYERPSRPSERDYTRASGTRSYVVRNGNPFAPAELPPNIPLPTNYRSRSRERRVDHRFSRSPSPRISRYRTSPPRRTTYDQRSPISREPEEILIRRKEYYYDQDSSRNKDDEWAFRPSDAEHKRHVDIEVIRIPRSSSPEEIREDVSDSEDAMLDDAELKNKMMIKYTGGALPFVVPDAVSPIWWLHSPQSKRQT